MSKLDIRNLNADEIIATSGAESVWISAEVDEKVYLLPAVIDNKNYIFPSAVIKFSEACLVSKPSGQASLQEALLMTFSVLGEVVPTVWNSQDPQTNSIHEILVTEEGKDYTNATITIGAPQGQPAIQATAKANIVDGRIQSVSITNKGSGYTSPPSVSISGNGSGAKLAKPELGRIPKSYCGVPSGEAFNSFNLNIDNNAANKFGFFPQYITPNAATIPIRSNIRTYGPFPSNNFANDYGGIDSETDQDIAPWVFGSIQAANLVGQARANEFPQDPLRISETGSVTLPGFPTLSFGQQLGSGPFLNSINMSFGRDGVKTSLDFQTYSEKYGSLQKPFRDQIKRSIKNRQKQLQFLRNQTIVSKTINRNVKRLQDNRSTTRPTQQQAARAGTMSRVMVGEIYDWQRLKQIESNRPIASSGQRVVVGIDTLSDSLQEMRYDYERKAYISLDALYSPVSISGGFPSVPISSGNVQQVIGFSGLLPRYVIPTTGGYVKHFASPIHPQPPFTTGDCLEPSIPSGMKNFNLQIHNLYLNPLANPSAIPYYSGISSGHNIDLVGRGSGIPSSGMLMSLYTEQENNIKYYKDYRFLGMRGPIVLHSWGYDVDGKPIPNFIDDENKAKSGIFTIENSGDPTKPSGLADLFMSDWLQKPSTWPTGPIDLRFDRERGVWVSPQPYKIVVAKVIEEVSAYGQGIGVVINEYSSNKYGRQLVDSSGNFVVGSGCEIDEEDEDNPFKENWVLTSIGQPNCPGGQDEIDIVTCIELGSDSVIATRKRIKVPGLIDLGTISPCIISTTTCEEPPTESPPPTDTPTEEPTPDPDQYYYLENCSDEATPQFIRIDKQEGDTYSGGETFYKEDQGCFTIISSEPSSFTIVSGSLNDWEYISGCSDCPVQDIWMKNCCPDLTPKNIGLIGYTGSPMPSTGEVYYINQGGVDGCFQVIGKKPKEFTSLNNPSLSSQSSCKDCLENNNIECPSASGDKPLITLVDRIGNSHSFNEMVYAYYDTYKSEYIVLGSRQATATIYGTISELTNSSGVLTIEGISSEGLPLKKGDKIDVSNILNFSIPSGCTVKGVATQFDIQ
jgi:hypothetical protein